MTFDPNWIIAASSTASLIGVYTIYKQLGSDHERSRRELAISLVRTWSTQLNRKATIARKLVETFNEQQIRALHDQEEFKVEGKYLDLVRGCLTEDSFYNRPGVTTDLKSPLDIHQKESAEIRWLIVSYLNLLESVLLAWHYSVADRNIIKTEFQYLVAPEKGHLILEKFRQVAGGIKAYPAIYAFVSEIQKTGNEYDGKPSLP